ncbi:MAG: hypothetical protein H6Q11_205 [Acidobacteria bacterium]|nr:hypothetical protein [Acidobacteriota bacterium]
MAHTDPKPTTRPTARPTPICATKSSRMPAAPVAGSVSSSRQPRVRNTAIGSLLPDSSSSRGRRSGLRETSRARRIENTAAASVEETTDPRSRPAVGDSPRIHAAASPTTAAVTSVPAVASAIPGPSKPRTPPLRVQPAGVQDEGQGHHPDGLGDLEVIEGDPAGPLRPGQHPYPQEGQQGRHPQPSRDLAGQWAQQQQQGDDDEGSGSAHAPPLRRGPRPPASGDGRC